MCAQCIGIHPRRLLPRNHWPSLVRAGFFKSQRARVTQICVSKLTVTGSYNGLSPGWHQAIVWTNAGIVLIRTLGTNVSEILIKIHTFSFTKCIWKCRLRNDGKCVSAPMCQCGTKWVSNKHEISYQCWVVLKIIHILTRILDLAWSK